MGDKISETIPEAPLPLFCANCGCPRQVRTRALLQDPDRDTPAERIERGTLVAYHDLTCSACGRRGTLFVFSGPDVLPPLERAALLMETP